MVLTFAHSISRFSQYPKKRIRNSFGTGVGHRIGFHFNNTVSFDVFFNDDLKGQCHKMVVEMSP
jgi:hypothetical protein